MKMSFRLATIAGIGVHVHVTFLMLLAFFSVVYFRIGGVEAVAYGLSVLLSIFACVVLHEYGHALAARRYGIGTRDITLLPIGGVARLERIPRRPRHEFVIAAAGPVVNVLLGGLGLALMAALGMEFAVPREIVGVVEQGESGQVAVNWSSYLPALVTVNGIIFLFNLIPAFPMDGGRILRSILATRMPHHRATEIAANVGKMFAVLFFFLGLQGHFLLILIAVFVFLGASGEASMAQMRHAFRGLPASAAMVTEFQQLKHTSTLSDAVAALLRSHQVDFPVLGAGGDLRGVLTRQRLVAALSTTGPETRVEDLPLAEVEPLDADAPLDTVWEHFSRHGSLCVPVVRDGRLIGLITSENVGEFVLVRQALEHSSQDLRRGGIGASAEDSRGGFRLGEALQEQGGSK